MNRASRLFQDHAANLTYRQLLRTASCSCAILPLKLNDSLHARSASGSSGQAQLGRLLRRRVFMRYRNLAGFGAALVVGAICGSLIGPRPAAAVAREIIELQR